MPRKPAIPAEVRAEVERIVAQFNRQHLSQLGLAYSVHIRGKYLYLDRNDFGKPSPICRLTYNGGMENWDFAIYKYSVNRYDAEEWFFPGAGEVDGTIEGALNAGLLAYPV